MIARSSKYVACQVLLAYMHREREFMGHNPLDDHPGLEEKLRRGGVDLSWDELAAVFDEWTSFTMPDDTTYPPEMGEAERFFANVTISREEFDAFVATLPPMGLEERMFAAPEE